RGADRRLRARATHAAAPLPEHPAAHDRAHDDRGRPAHPSGVGDFLHRLRHPAADAVLGEHAHQCGPVPRQGSVPHLPAGHRGVRDRALPVPGGRRPARRARPPSEVITLAAMARVAAGLALLLVSCQAVPSVATPAPSAVVAGGTLRVAIPAEVTVLDPWNADSASQVATRQIFETLVTVDPATGAVAAGLASSWQMANDGASWTFALRGGISFADGTPFDAATVVASFDRGRGTRAYRLLFDEPSAISRVVALDGKTVRFELRAPFGPFLVHLAAPQAGIARGTSGTGPFTAAPDALAPDGSITLRRNEAYWLRTSGGRTLPYLDGLVLRPVRDAAARFAELRAGRVDLALELPVAQATAARSDPNLALLTRPSAASATLGIDVAAPPFDQPDARRAVAMAIDRGALALETTLVGLDPDDVFWPLFGTDDPRDASLTVGLLRKARMEADPSKRAELYKQVSKLARAEVTRVPLLIVDRAIAASARVAGYVAETNASFGTVWLRP